MLVVICAVIHVISVIIWLLFDFVYYTRQVIGWEITSEMTCKVSSGKLNPIDLLIGVGGSSANDLTTGSTTSPAISEHVYAPVDDKRQLETAAFEERRSMQPIGTERMNKKPRTTGGLVAATHGTQSFTFVPPANIVPPWAASTSSLHKCMCYRLSRVLELYSCAHCTMPALRNVTFLMHILLIMI